MAPSVKKRMSTGSVQETTSNGNRIHFPPTKRTVRSRTPAWSAPSKRQQTITQMDPFYSIFHPNSEDENLEYDESIGDDYTSLSREPKRRKSTPKETPVRRILTRNAVGRITESAPGRQEARKISAGQNKDGRAVKREWRAQETRPPLEPRTPQRPKRVEIPSSQSPADTPLSSGSLRHVRGVSRSPLKERATNASLPRIPARNEGRWAKKMEVPDSMKSDTFESPMSISATSRYTRKILNSSSRGKASRESLQETLSSPHGHLADKTNEEELENPTQPQHFESTSLKNDKSSDSVRPPYHWHHPSESESASAQLFDDLRRATQTGVLEKESQFANSGHCYVPTQTSGDLKTDSQFENVWHPYALPRSCDHESASNRFSFQPEKINEASSPTTTVRTQPICPHPNTTTATAPKVSIPPSQATTTDATQQSSCKNTLSSQTFPSSPPPMPPPSSSPLTSRKATDQWLGYEWNGGRLTDSQLLPESLMNDTLIGPPDDLSLLEDTLEEEA